MLRFLFGLMVAFIVVRPGSAEPAGWAITIVSPTEAVVGDARAARDVKLALQDVPGFLRGADPELKRVIFIRVANPDRTPYVAVNSLIAGIRRVGYDKISLVTDERDGKSPGKAFDADKVAELLNRKRASEEDVLLALNRQLEPCALLPGTSGTPNLPIVTLKFHLKKDGSVDGDVAVLHPRDEPLFKVAAEASVRAVKLCAPFRLPAERYDLWNTVTWAFDWPVITGTKSAAPESKQGGRDRYKAAVIARIMETARKARPDIVSGKGVLTVVIEPDGRIQVAGGHRIEGTADLDGIIGAAAWKSGPFPAFSAEMGKENLYVAESLDFSQPARTPGDVYAEQVYAHAKSKMGRGPRGKGVAIVLVRLNAEGGVVERKIEKTSGKKQIDEAALSVIDQAAPFPRAFPEVAADGRNLLYHVTFRYK